MINPHSFWSFNRLLLSFATVPIRLITSLWFAIIVIILIHLDPSPENGFCKSSGGSGSSQNLPHWRHWSQVAEMCQVVEDFVCLHECDYCHAELHRWQIFWSQESSLVVKQVDWLLIRMLSDIIMVLMEYLREITR